MLTRFVLRLIINAVALWVAFQLVPGIQEPAGWLPIVVLALIFGLVNALVRPLLELITCPFLVLTLGLGILLINTLLFWLTGLIGNVWNMGFTVGTFWDAFLGALIVSVVSFVLSLVLRDELKGRRPRPRRQTR